MPVSASTSPPAPAVSVLGRELVTLQLDYVLKLAADPGEGGKLNLVRWFAFLHFVLSP